MATKKVIIPVGFQFEDISTAVKDAKSKLSSIKIESGIGQQYTRAFSQLEREIESIQKKAARGISSQSDIDSIERSLQTVIGYVEKIQNLSGKISFKDVKLTPEQLAIYNQLNKELEKARTNISQFKKEQIKNLFATDTNFSAVLKDQLNITEKSFTTQKQISDALKAQAKTLQEQTAERTKQLKQEESLRDNLATNNVSSLLGTYGKKTSSGYIFNRGMAEEGRTKLLEEFKRFNMDTTGLEEASLNKLMSSWQTFSSQLSTSIPQAIAASNQALQELKNKQDAVKAAKEALDAAMSAGSYDQLVLKVKQAQYAEEAYRNSVVQAAQATVSSMNTSTSAVSDGVEEQKKDLLSLQQQFSTAMSAEILASNLQASLKQLVGFSAILIQIRRGIQEAVSQIKELDSAMNGIAVVTDFTTAELWSQIDAYMAMAKQYGVTTTGVYEVSQLYYQQGLNTNEVLNMTTETLKMARIAGLDYGTTTNYMTTALNGFKLSTDDASRVVDVYSKLASIAATDTAELAKAMSNTASIAESAGMSFESTSAMLTMMIETTREAPENLGTALKTITARFQEMKSNPTQIIELDGEEASLNKVDTALASVGISLKDASGQFRNLDEVIFELADVWDTLDRNTQRWIANTTAGSRQQSRFLALMSDSERLHELYNEAINSEDASLVQYAKTLDSIDGKMNQLSTSFQQFYMNIIDGEAIKSILDFATQFLDRMNEAGTLGAVSIVGSILTSVNSIAKALIFIITSSYQQILDNFKKTSQEKIAINRQAAEQMAQDNIIADNQANQQIIQNRRYKDAQGNYTNGIKSQPGQNLLNKVPQIFSSGVLNSAINALSQAANYMNLIGTMAYSMGDQSDGLDELSLATNGFAAACNVARIATSAFTGDIGGMISGIVGLVSSLNLAINSFQTVAERIEYLNSKVEEANIARATAKQELDTLESLKKQYDELSSSQNDSADVYQEWIDLNSKIIADYPTLNTYIDSEGNLIADLTTNYEELVQQKQNDYDISLKEYELSLKRRASDPAYALSQSGVLVNDSLFGGNTSRQISLFERSTDIGSYTSLLSSDIFSILDRDVQIALGSYEDIDTAIEKVNEVVMSIINGAESFETLSNNGDYITQQIVIALKAQGYTTDILQKINSRYEDIKYGADEELSAFMKTKISNLASEQDDKVLSNVLNARLNALWQQAITTGTEAGQLISDIYDDFANNLDTNILNIINYYRENLIGKESDIAAITSSRYDLSLKAYTELDNAVKTYFDQDSSLGIWLKNVTDANKEITGIAALGVLESFSVSNQNKIIEIRKSLNNLDPNKYDLGTLFDIYYDTMYLLAESGLDQKTISSLLSDADLTSRSGITKFLDTVDQALIAINSGYNTNSIREWVSNIKVTQADIDNGMTALSDALTETSKYVNKLDNLDFSDIQTLISTGLFSADDFDGSKYIGSVEDFYGQYLSFYKTNLEDYIEQAKDNGEIDIDTANLLLSVINDLIQNAINSSINNISSAYKTALSNIGNKEIIIDKDVLETIGFTEQQIKDNFELTLDGYKFTGSQREFLALLKSTSEYITDDILKTIVLNQIEALGETAESVDLDTSTMEDMLSLIGDDAINSLTEEIYDSLSDWLDEESVAFNILTRKYDFNGTVQEYLDAVEQYIINTFGIDSLQYTQFNNWRKANEAKITEAQTQATTISALDEVASQKLISDYSELIKIFRNVGGSAEDAYVLINKLGYSIEDFYSSGDGKLKLINTSELKIIDNIVDMKNEIDDLQKRINSSTSTEQKRLQAILAIRKEELKALKDKQLLVASSANEEQFTDPKTFLGNITDLDSIFEELNKKSRIEYESLYNLLNNEEWAGALSHSLGLIEGAQKEGITAAEYFAKHYTDAYADIDTGKVFLKLSAEQVDAIKSGTEDSLKAIAESRIQEIDAQIAMLESLNALSDIEFEGIEIEGFAKFVWTDNNGNKLEDPVALWDYLAETISDPAIWQQLQNAVQIEADDNPIDVAIKILTYLSQDSEDVDSFLASLGIKREVTADVDLNADVNTASAEQDIQQAVDQATDTPLTANQTVNVNTTTTTTTTGSNTPTDSVVSTQQNVDIVVSASPDSPIYEEIESIKNYIGNPENAAYINVEADTTPAKDNVEDFISDTENTSALVKIKSDVSIANVNFKGFVNTIRSTIANLRVGITDYVTSAVNNLVNSINSRTATIKVYTENISSSTSSSSSSSSNSRIRNDIVKPYANGGISNTSSKALVGELGPEIRVSDGKYSVVGANGAEFINLKKNDIIFNADQTNRLLNGKTGVRGTALAYGNVSGPAYASGIEAAIAALRSERTMWASILNSIPDMLKKAGSSSGGGGSNNEYLMELERWFNWLRQIEQLENKITVLRAKRENIKDGKAYANSLYEENALLKKQSDITQDLLNNQIEYRDSLKTNYLQNYGKYFYFVGDALQINAQAILADTENNEELGETIQNMIDEYDDITQQITDNTTALEENTSQIEENIQALRDKYIEMEEEVLSALKNMYEKQIELKQEELDARVEADEQYLSALKKNLEREKAMRDKSSSEEEKAQLQRKLALLERDTSGKNAKEIASLREQLRDLQEEEYYSGREEAISAAEEAAENEQNILQGQIDTLTKINQIKLDNMELYWAEVENIINQGAENALSFLQSYSTSYLDTSKIQQEDYLNTWKFTIDAALTYAQDMQQQFDEVIYAAQQAINYGNTNATGGLNTPSSSNNSSGSSSSSSSSNSSNSSSSNGKTPSSSNSSSDVDIVSGADGKPQHGWYYQINKNGSSTGITGGPYSDRPSAQSAGQKKAASMGYGYKYSTKYYLKGGLVDYTGPAWVDGTKSKPESFLSAEDTQLLANFVNYAHKTDLFGSLEYNSSSINPQKENDVSIGNVEIIIESGVIANTADATEVGMTITEQLMKIARQSGNISVSRR